MFITNKIFHEILNKSNSLCCLCLNSSGLDAHNIHDEVIIGYNLEDETTFNAVLEYLFGSEVTNISILSNALCETCAKAAIESYKFMKKSKEVTDILNTLLGNFMTCIENDNFSANTLYLAVDPETHSTALFIDKIPILNKYSAIKRFRKLVTDHNITDELPTFSSIVKIENAIKNNKPITCDKCDAQFTSKYSLKRHLSKSCKNGPKVKIEDDECKSNTKKKKVYLFCHKCGTRCSNKKALNKHLTSKCETVKIPNITTKPKNEICTDCGKAFTSVKALETHRLNHEFVVCSECGKSIRATLIDRHLLTHTTRLECNRCGKVYRHLQSYQEHMKDLQCFMKTERQPLPKNFVCDICKKKFGRKSSLRVHMRDQHGEEKKLDCIWCEKKFLSASKLKNHIVTHTQEKNFECHVCGGRYVTKVTLALHMRQHTGEKPYKCKFCDKTFLSTSRRADHVRAVHKPPSLECQICFKKFKRHGALSKHRARHSNPKSSLYQGV